MSDMKDAISSWMEYDFAVNGDDGGLVAVYADHEDNAIELAVSSNWEGFGSGIVMLSYKQARQLAKALREAADA